MISCSTYLCEYCIVTSICRTSRQCCNADDINDLKSATHHARTFLKVTLLIYFHKQRWKSTPEGIVSKFTLEWWSTWAVASTSECQTETDIPASYDPDLLEYGWALLVWSVIMSLSATSFLLRFCTYHRSLMIGYRSLCCDNQSRCGTWLLCPQSRPLLLYLWRLIVILISFLGVVEFCW